MFQTFFLRFAFLHNNQITAFASKKKKRKDEKNQTNGNAVLGFFSLSQLKNNSNFIEK